MRATIDEIIVSLEQSEKVYQRLLAVMHREKKAALGSNPRSLTEVSLEKEALLAQLSVLEKGRLRLIKRAADDLKIPASRLSLSILAEKADDNQRPRIMQLRNTFGDLIISVKKENEANRALIQHCLDLTKNTLGFFQHWVMPASIYGATGQVASGQKNGKLISGTV